MRTILTHEEKLKRRRERYSKRKDDLNVIRRDKYAIGRESGLSYKQARTLRGYGSEHITKQYKNIRYEEQAKIYYIYKVPKKIDLIPIPPEKKVSKRTRRRREARELGYTPDEADYLRGVSENKWQEIISNMVVIDSAGRENRWAMMASKERYDKRIIEACEAINLEEGYDINSRYGWAVYYFWYLYGGDIEHWKSYCEPDTFNTDMLGYKGNAGTYLSRIGVKIDKKLKKYEKAIMPKMKYKKKEIVKKKGTPRTFKNVSKDKKRPYKRTKTKVS